MCTCIIFFQDNVRRETPWNLFYRLYSYNLTEAQEKVFKTLKTTLGIYVSQNCYLWDTFFANSYNSYNVWNRMPSVMLHVLNIKIFHQVSTVCIIKIKEKLSILMQLLSTQRQNEVTGGKWGQEECRVLLQNLSPRSNWKVGKVDFDTFLNHLLWNHCQNENWWKQFQGENFWRFFRRTFLMLWFNEGKSGQFWSVSVLSFHKFMSD